MGTLAIVCVFLLIIMSISTLPISIEKVPRIELPSRIENLVVSEVVSEKSKFISDRQNITSEVVVNDNDVTKVTNVTLRNIRPGMSVVSYDIEIEPNVAQRTFNGKLLVTISITDANTREDPIKFNVDGLTIESVQFAIGSSGIYNPLDEFFINDDNELEIFAGTAMAYSLIIEYQGVMDTAARGMFSASDGSYIGMHLSPTHARRVFPCIDELTEPSSIRFRFNNVPFNYIISNSIIEDGQQDNNYQYRTLEGPPLRWGMVAHNLSPTAIAIDQARFFIRSGTQFQDAFASSAITDYFRFFEEWTERSYFGMVVDQNPELHIVALPDTSVDWIAMSSVCIWEPDILMETNPSMKQRKTAMIKIAEGLARQWFGYVIYPETWNSMWIINGLESYAAYEAAKRSQTSNNPDDRGVLDVQTLFITDVMRESLLLDGHSHSISMPLEPADTIDNEDDIRDHIHGLIKHKSPALLRMFRTTFGNQDIDSIQAVAAALLKTRAQQTVNTLHFLTELEGSWQGGVTELPDFEEVEDFITRWTQNVGYPVITISLTQGGVVVREDPFSFARTTAPAQDAFFIPLTYTSSRDANFDEAQVYNTEKRIMKDRSAIIDVDIDDDEEEGEFALFNIRGEGYYRVNYHNDLWIRIIEFLEDPDQRNQIHPLNRAVLVDDSLNLARGRIIDYDVALQLVLTMESETEYAPWKAYVRNMEFVRKALEAVADEDEDLDPTLYQRMLRRTMVRFEQEIGFEPDTDDSAMISLTRGLVMEHACKAGYEPCVAAAVDWFISDSDSTTVNPNIPPELRPAVYCAMVRQGGEEPIEALNNRLEIENSAYERVVIIQSLACSPDTDFIRQLLINTVADGELDWGVEERVKFFEAVVESNLANLRVAVNFFRERINDIRRAYGGQEKLEGLLYHIAHNIVDNDSYEPFRRLVSERDTGIDDSEEAGRRALEIANNNLEWSDDFREVIYEWIDENGAPSLIVSISLFFACLFAALINNN